MKKLSYYQQAKIVAWLEIVSSVVGFVFVSLCTIVLALCPDIRKDILKEDPENILNIILHFSIPEKVTSVAVPIIYFIGEFMLATFLLRGILYRNYSHLRIWYIATVTICLTATYFFLPGVFFTDDSLYFIGIFVASYAFTAYSIFVVYSFMQDLKRDGLHQPVATWEDDAEKL